MKSLDLVIMQGGWNGGRRTFWSESARAVVRLVWSPDIAARMMPLRPSASKDGSVTVGDSETVGDTVGETVGDTVGAVGDTVGETVGETVGAVGDTVGAMLGQAVPSAVPSVEYDVPR